MSRIVFDLKFWRPFVSCEPKATLQNVLGRLPENSAILASDVSTSWGMAGTVIFSETERKTAFRGFEGLFWQIAWSDWERIVAIESLKPGQVEINAAEFLAALITCETFTELCSGKITYQTVFLI